MRTERPRRRTRRARQLGTTLAAIILLTFGCSGSGSNDESDGSVSSDDGEGSCPRALRFEGRTYSDVRAPGQVEFTSGKKLGTAQDACPLTDDGTPSQSDTPWTPAVYEVAGLDSKLAIAVGDTPGELEFFAAHQNGRDDLPSDVETFLLTH